MLSKATFHFDQTNLDRGIAESAPPDLTLLAGGRSYQMNSYLAAAKSNYIYRILLSDPLTMSIEIDLPKKKLTPLINFLNGAKFDLETKFPMFFFETAITLEITELIYLLFDTITQKLHLHYFIDLYKRAFNQNIDCTIFANFVYHHFDDFMQQQLYNFLSSEHIDFIIKKTPLYSRADLLEPIFENFEVQTHPNCRLAKYASGIKWAESNCNLNTLRFKLLHKIFVTPVSD